MGARRIGRERALQALYQMEMSALRPEDALETAWNADDDERQQDYADDSGQSLQEHLLWQLELASGRASARGSR